MRRQLSAQLITANNLSVVSFNGNKTVTAGGGGMVVGNDKNLLAKLKHLSTTARVTAEYDHDMVGYNYRMTNIQAAVGCAQLEQLEKFVAKKKYIREFYHRELSDIDENLVDKMKDHYDDVSLDCNSRYLFAPLILIATLLLI